ncbi:MerR family transcriptional regulator [Streptomyces sp. NE06-03E]|uniref:MerR family transcriptional regulator n=2 Tax=Streptomyces TaxID=1883 RepID=A0A652KP23_9ACTN|nr:MULTISPECIES: MerR family transcriptional regulator [unclassified Streptomyces]WSS74644.1 MerR family transcriptional regulator [Streptomyces sp. NBC_01174]MDX3057986.1 MerR family transcriptional regulator [Streptomyces sp. NE06-03E]MDX3327439.1 MerR family transcriptional regulator [Streptomyces sp. ME02-6979-3A]MDX3432475.1 MerR family transcriptional regulator [Streptomyces sp. ME01-18a]MDX3685170.1 MerR family transcriptional regulator [Streptomyces sp. AK04-4c]
MLRTPTGGAGHGTAAAGERAMSIGTVLLQLRDEFPEVTISKIRFLETEGLIEPQRTPSGYRKFSPADVDRLAQVLRMQRDHYLPLKVIREHLEALARGEQVALPPGGGQGDPGDALRDQDPGQATATRIGRAELLAATEATEEQLDEWESYGLIVPAAGGSYDAEAVTVARLVADLGRFGLEPRHLRAVKAAAEREAGLVDQVVAPLRRHRNPQTRAHAESTARELADLSVRLHAALMQTALKATFH